MTAVAAGQFTLTATIHPVEIHTGQICLLFPVCNTIPVVSANMTVQKPNFLQVVSSAPANACQGHSCQAVLNYKVLDSFQQPMRIAGMIIRESVSSDTTISDSSQWTTDSSGTMIGIDGIDTCCNGSTCQTSFTQTFTVNGYGVFILSQDGTRTGTHNAITTTCTSGSGGCPSVVITP
jgi:hypothetical protein